MEVNTTEELMALPNDDLKAFIKQKTEEYEQSIIVSKQCIQFMNQTRDELLAAIEEYNAREAEELLQ